MRARSVHNRCAVFLATVGARFGHWPKKFGLAHHALALQLLQRRSLAPQAQTQDARVVVERDAHAAKAAQARAQHGRAAHLIPGSVRWRKG